MKVFGRVQMVMFRDFVKRKARSLDLVGYVKNLSDGSVEIITQGTEEKIRQLFDASKRGPMFARVDKYEIDSVALPDEYKGFNIEY